MASGVNEGLLIARYRPRGGTRFPNGLGPWTGRIEHDLDHRPCPPAQRTVAQDAGGPQLDGADQSGRDHLTVVANVHVRIDLPERSRLLQAVAEGGRRVVLQHRAPMSPSGEQRPVQRRVSNGDADHGVDDLARPVARILGTDGLYVETLQRSVGQRAPHLVAIADEVVDRHRRHLGARGDPLDGQVLLRILSKQIERRIEDAPGASGLAALAEPRRRRAGRGGWWLSQWHGAETWS